MQNIDQTLEERGKRYGDFMGHALIAQALLDVIEKMPSWAYMEADQKQCLRAFADKVGRIGNGDPHYPDNWHDIAGYATLVYCRLQEGVASIPLGTSELPELLRKFEDQSKQSSEASQ